MMPSRIRPWFAITVICILVAASVAGFLTVHDPGKKWSVDGVRKEFTNLSLRPSAQIETPPSLTTKYGLVSISASYLAQSSFQDVARLYRQELELNGWQEMASQRAGSLIFCKPNLILRMENIGPSMPLASRFQIAISSSSESARVCR
jgi:hypothetical protein